MTEASTGQDMERNGIECSVEVTKEGFLEEVVSEKALKDGEELLQVGSGGCGKRAVQEEFFDSS